MHRKDGGVRSAVAAFPMQSSVARSCATSSAVWNARRLWHSAGHGRGGLMCEWRNRTSIWCAARCSLAFPMQYSIHACAARKQSRRAVPLCRAGHPNDGADERSRGAQGCSVSAAAASFPMQCGLRGLSAPACSRCRRVAACRHFAEAPLSESSSAACTGRMGESDQLWRRSRCSTAYMHVQPDSSPDARCLCAEPDIRTMEQMSAAEARRAALSVQQLHRSRCNAG